MINHQTGLVLTTELRRSNLIFLVSDSVCDDKLNGSNLYPRFEGIIFYTYYRYERCII